MRIILGVCFSLMLGLSGASHAASRLPAAGKDFKDCADCPAMVVLPQKSFMMGAPDNETGKEPFDGPQRKVTIAYPVAVGKFEITNAEWEACLRDGGCTRVPRPACRAEMGCTPYPMEAADRPHMPVTDISWIDAQGYVRWLSAKTGATYRLLTEAEWEFAARAGAKTAYAWGDTATRHYANYGMDKCCGPQIDGDDKWELLSPVGSFPANAYGVYDLAGNTWAWVPDCWDENPATGPIDGSAREVPDCHERIMRGGSWASLPQRIRPAFRQGSAAIDRDNFIGFRVARSK